MHQQLDATEPHKRCLLTLVVTVVIALLTPRLAVGLAPGDIAIIGYHSNGATTSTTEGDAFAWVPLVDLPAGEVLYFSDTGYFSSEVSTNNGFGGTGGGTDGVVQFTVPLGGIPFGQVQTIGNPINPTPAPYSQPTNAYINATGALTSSTINFSGSGDQIIAFQDNDLLDTAGFEPLFAVNGASSSWTSGVASDRNQTNLYPGLLDGSTAIALGEGPGSQQAYDNARYKGTVIGSRSELLAEITNPANWDRTNGVNETGNIFPWITNGVSQFFTNANPPSQLKILMIGNSYTQGNASAPATFEYLQGLFDANTNLDVEIVNESFSGASLSQHADSGSDAVAELINSSGEYDYVVLQERSDRPARAMKFGGGELSGLNNGGPVLIDDYIKVHQPQAEVILFNSWARHPSLEPANDDDLATYFNNDPVEMQNFTNLGIEHIITGSSLGDLSDVASTADIGKAWQEWYTTYGYANFGALLHESDGTHQNDRGAYLAAAVLYEKITGETVIGNAYSGNVTGNLGGNPFVTLLQQQAARFGSVLLPGDYNDDGSVDAADYTVWRDHFGESAGTLPNDFNGGMIGTSQYDTWREYYGSSLPAASVQLFTSIPEPSGRIVAFIGCLFFFIKRNNSFALQAFTTVEIPTSKNRN